MKFANDNIIFPFKNRTIDYSKPVYIYRNLYNKTNNDKYSIKQLGLVVAHTSQIMLKDCKFIINEWTRLRSLQLGHKLVHAFVKGYITGSGMGITANGCLPAQIRYDYKKYSSFTCHNLTKNPFPVVAAANVIINKHGVSAAYTEKY